MAFLMLTPVLCFIPQEANAQTPAVGSVIVYPDAQVPIYGSIGHNWTITFQARWQYNQTDEPVSNATVEFKVTNPEGKTVNTFDCNTTQGTFSFNYSSNKLNILTFTPTKLTMQDKTEWILTQPEKTMVNSYISVTVYWDTFSVALINSTTSGLGAADVSVKVTHLLMPHNGLAVYVGPRFTEVVLGNEVYNANVTINGVAAQETSTPGVYIANFSTAFPTAYTLVTVSQNEWKTTETAFSIPHSANLRVWLIAAGAVAASAAVFFLAFKLKSFKADRNSKYPFLGGLFLLFAAAISVYWAAVSLEAVANGFNWLIFAALEVCSFLLGTVCAVFAMRRKNQAAVIFSVTILLVVNSVVAMSSLGAYALPMPWLLVGVAVVCCAVAFLMVSNADEEFAKTKQTNK